MAASRETSFRAPFFPRAMARSAGQEALRLWVLKTFLQFGYENNPSDINPAVSLLLKPEILDDWGTFALGPGETLTVSKPGDGEALVVEFTRDNGRKKKPTLIRGDYDGKSSYFVTVQFPQMDQAMTMAQFRNDKSSPLVAKYSDGQFAGWLVEQEQLADVESLARRQLNEPGFKAWEHMRDKYVNTPPFSPRVSLLNEITSAELYHLLDWKGFEKEYKLEGHVRTDIVYGFLGDKELGEAKPIDKQQAEIVRRKLVQMGYKLDEESQVFRKKFVYKHKEVINHIRVTQPALSNIVLTRGSRDILASAGVPDAARKKIIREILEAGHAGFAQLHSLGAGWEWVADRINALIEEFKRAQNSRSLEAKKAFEEGLFKADALGQDGHAGAGSGFGFSAASPSHDDLYSFRIGKITPYIYRKITEITKNEFLRKLLRMSKYNSDGYFDWAAPFALPFSEGRDMRDRLIIDPRRQRQLLFIDACESLNWYDKLWSQLLRTYQKVVSPNKFDMVGTLNDSDPADGVAAKLTLVEAVEKALNPRQFIDLLHARAVHGTKYGPGKHMGVDGEGTYKELYADPFNKSSAVTVSNNETAGFIIDNNGAQVGFSAPSSQQKSYPLRFDD